mmetsp:Transcript_14052/g.37732  ORF Transcript_14052/g.37732 Transcript_14052/m.37732 type:complete len:209 (-) Transcript_14052:181-807(-)
MRVRNHLLGILSRFCLAAKRVLVLALAFGGFVHAEPLAHRVNLAWELALHVGNIIHQSRLWVFRVNRKQLPIRLAFVQQRKHAERLHGIHRAHRHDLVTNFNDVERIIVATKERIRMHVAGILPCLRQRAIVDERVAVFVEAQLALLDILLDRSERLVRGDFHLGRCALRNLIDVVQQLAILAAVQRHIMPHRDLLSRRGILESDAKI